MIRKVKSILESGFSAITTSPHFCGNTDDSVIVVCNIPFYV